MRLSLTHHTDGAAAAGPNAMTHQLEDGGDGLRVQTTVQIAGLTVPLSATGTVRLDGGTLVLDVQDATTAGVEVPGGFLDQVSDALGSAAPAVMNPAQMQTSARLSIWASRLALS